MKCYLLWMGNAPDAHRAFWVNESMMLSFYFFLFAIVYVIKPPLKFLESKPF